MNRVQEWVRKISTAKDSLERLECQYHGAIKGTIYKTSVHYQKKLIADMTSKINEFGSNKFNYWSINYINKSNLLVNIELILDYTITEEEIIDRLSLNGFTVEDLVKTKSVVTGFPRIT